MNVARSLLPVLSGLIALAAGLAVYEATRPTVEPVRAPEPAPEPATPPPPEPTAAAAASLGATWAPVDDASLQEGPLGVRFATVVPGDGEPLSEGDPAWIAVALWLPDGTRIGATEGEGSSLAVAGGGDTLPGISKLLVGMRPGERRHLRLPAEAAYGARSVAGVPAESDLVAEVIVRRRASPRSTPPRCPTGEEAWTPLREGLEIATITAGAGPASGPGAAVLVDWAAWHDDGTALETTWRRAEPVRATLGDGVLPPSIDAVATTLGAGGRAAFRLRHDPVAPPLNALQRAAMKAPVVGVVEVTTDPAPPQPSPPPQP